MKTKILFILISLLFFNNYSLCQSVFPQNTFGDAVFDGQGQLHTFYLINGGNIQSEAVSLGSNFLNVNYTIGGSSNHTAVRMEEGFLHFWEKGDLPWKNGSLFMNTAQNGKYPVAGFGMTGSGSMVNNKIYIAHGTTPWESTLGIHILRNGNTGVGVLTPSTRLHIKTGTENDSGLRLENLTSSSPSTGNAKAIGVTSTGKVVTIDVESGSSDRAWLTTGNDEITASNATYGNDVNNNFLGTTDNQALVIATNNRERLRISTSGRLTFHNNDISPNSVNNLYIGGGNEVSIGVNNYANTAIGLGSLPSVTSASNRNTVIGSNALVRNNGNKNIGIGYLVGPALTSGSGNILIGSEVDVPISSTADNQLNIGDWIFGFEGQIAIGDFTDLETAFTTNEDYRLIVKDGIRTEMVRVDLANVNNWADYVFEDGYNLLPIKDLEQFILRNKHLPNIPTAEQLVKEGIDLAEMDAKLLEKIEELTLYNIDLNKKNET